MKIKNGFVLSKVGDSTVAVATGELTEKFPGALILNPSGKLLFEMLSEKDCNAEELISALLKRYDVTPDNAKKDLDAFLNTLRTAGILEES